MKFQEIKKVNIKTANALVQDIMSLGLEWYGMNIWVKFQFCFFI